MHEYFGGLMSYVDIAIIAIIALFALIGMWKGVGKTAIKIICFAGAIVITYFVAEYVINWLLGVEFLRGFIVGDGLSLRTLYYNAIGGEAFVGAESLTGAMNLYVQPMIDRYFALGIEDLYAMSVAEFTAISLALNTLSILICVIVYSLARVVCAIVGWIFGKIFLHGDTKVLSRLLGFVFGSVRGAIWVMVALIISTVIMPFGWALPYSQTVKGSVIGNTAATYTYQFYDTALFGTTEADKTITLLESAGYVPLSFEEKQAKAESDLVNYRVMLETKSVYSDKGKAELDSVLNSAKTTIQLATDSASLKLALANGKKMLDDVATSEQENKIESLKSYYEGLCVGKDLGTVAQLTGAYSEGVTAIKNANDSESIELAFDNCKLAMNALVGA